MKTTGKPVNLTKILLNIKEIKECIQAAKDKYVNAITQELDAEESVKQFNMRRRIESLEQATDHINEATYWIKDALE